MIFRPSWPLGVLWSCSNENLTKFKFFEFSIIRMFFSRTFCSDVFDLCLGCRLRHWAELPDISALVIAKIDEYIGLSKSLQKNSALLCPMTLEHERVVPMLTPFAFEQMVSFRNSQKRAFFSKTFYISKIELYIYCNNCCTMITELIGIFISII